MEPSEEDGRVAQVVMEYLRTADMNTTTERVVLQHVQSILQLSRPIQEYKRLVSTTIDKFLESLDDGEEEGAAEEEAEEEETEAGHDKGRKRAGGAYDKKPAAKRSRGEPDDVLLSVDLAPMRKAKVKRFKGKLYVDVREYYMGDNEALPSFKGLNMEPTQWGRLARALPDLVQAQRAGKVVDPGTQLSLDRMASVTEFKGKYYLSLREFWSKDGKMLPSKKGINLGPEEAQILLAASDKITAAAGGMPEPEPLPAPGGAPEEAGEDEHALATVDLGGTKRMRVSRFNNRVFVDLREFIKKDGKMFPGKKGIALSPEDWATLCDNLQSITTALKQADTSYQLTLTRKRRVSISVFKGVTYVGVREFYDKGGGELAPGAKGLSMNADQWNALVGGVRTVTSALNQARQPGQGPEEFEA